MKAGTRRLLNFLFIAATLALVVALAFSNGELTNAWDAIKTMELPWLVAALGGWFCYLFFDALGMYYFLKKQKQPITLKSALYVSLIGFYYGNITPGASGGQPMQVYYMSKREIPVAIGTSAISIKFFASQVMVVLLASVLWVCNRDFVNTQLAGVKWAIWIGYAINALAIPLILLVALHRPLVQTIINFGIRIGAKLRLVKHPEETTLRVDAGLDKYHASILRLAKNPWQIVGQLGLAGLSILGLMSVPLSVYQAFGMSGVSWNLLLTASFLLFLSASYTPLPGASGAQEGGFLAFFHGIFTQGTIGLALLVWRFFTYYLFLLIGAGLTIVTNLRSSRSRRQEERRKREEATEPKAP